MRGAALKVVVPYTRYHSEVLDALHADGHDPLLCDVSGSDDAYWTLFDQLWRKGETFTIVEHDIVVRPGALDELASCPSPWCSFLVPYVGREYAGLACAKFSAELLAREPGALDSVALMQDSDHPPKHWCRLDSNLQCVLNAVGVEMCEHEPALEHLRPGDEYRWPSHDCWRR